jgi:hypothetical protein
VLADLPAILVREAAGDLLIRLSLPGTHTTPHFRPGHSLVPGLLLEVAQRRPAFWSLIGEADDAPHLDTV